MRRLSWIVAVLAACGAPAERAGSPVTEGVRRPRNDETSNAAPSPSPESERDSGPTVVQVAPDAVPVDAPLPEPSPDPPSEPSPAQRALDAATPFRLPPPPLRRTLARAPSPVRAASLRRVSSQRNRVTDVDAWFRTHQLTDPVLRVQGRPATLDPSAFPTLAGQRLVRVVPQAGSSILLYAQTDGSRGPSALVAVITDDGELRALFDLVEYTGGRSAGVDEMETRFAWVVGDVLYVSNSHRTYASSTGGHNAYVSAIDMVQRALIWRSAPLEANAQTFAVVGDVIVTGYGFTDEKDDLYVLDRHTGRRLSRHRLDAGPRYILERGGRIFVRAYDHDYELELTVRTR